MTLEAKDILSLVALVVSLTTFLVNWRYQRKTKRLEMALSACNLLLGRLDQIETLFTFSSARSFGEWSEHEKKIARDISGTFHLVGVLAEEGLVPGDLMSQIWYYSIPKAHASLREYLASIRTDRGPSYWSGFDLLVERAKKNGPYLDASDPRLIK